MAILRESTLEKEGPLRVSKWIALSLLVDEKEMAALFDDLQKRVGAFLFYRVQGLSSPNEEGQPPSFFLEKYEEYIHCLKSGETPLLDNFRMAFSSALSREPDALYAVATPQNKRLVKPCLPVVQMQINQIRYSPEERRFRSQLFGSGGITWGIQLAYPQLFQDSKTYELLPKERLPNTCLFQAIQKWVRHNTVATPFIVAERRLVEPIRLGKACFSWIDRHAELRAQNITIDEPRKKNSNILCRQ